MVFRFYQGLYSSTDFKYVFTTSHYLHDYTSAVIYLPQSYKNRYEMLSWLASSSIPLKYTVTSARKLQGDGLYLNCICSDLLLSAKDLYKSQVKFIIDDLQSFYDFNYIKHCFIGLNLNISNRRSFKRQFC